MSAALVLTAGCTTTVTGRGTAAGGSATSTSAPAPPPTSPTGSPTAPTPTPPPSPTGAPALPCPGQDVRARPNADLSAVLPSGTPRRLPVSRENSGPQALAQVVARYPPADRATARQVLLDAGFRTGFQRTWAAGTAGAGNRKVEVLTVYRFDAPAGACRFAALEAATFRLEAIPVAGVPGAVGVANSADRLRTANVLGTKGGYVVEAAALTYGQPVDFWTVEVLRAAYRVL